MFGKKNGGGFTYAAGHPLAEEHALIEKFLKEAQKKANFLYSNSSLKQTVSGGNILKLTPETLRGVIVAAQERLQYMEPAYRKLEKSTGSARTSSPLWVIRAALFALQRDLLKRKLPFTEPDIESLLEWFNADLSGQFSYYLFPGGGVINALKHYANSGQSTEKLIPIAERILKKTADHPGKEIRRLGDRILDILGIAPDLPMRPGEAWSDAAIEYVGDTKGDTNTSWAALLAHCTSVSGGKPTKKWSTAAEKLIADLTPERFAEAVAQWFPLVDQPRTQPIEEWPEWQPNPNLLIDDVNADILKGLVWASAMTGEPALADPIGKLALSAYRKAPGVGPRAPKIGNACVWALGQIHDDSSLAALAILKVRVKYKPAQKGITTALEAAAERAGMTTEELEEIGVPAYGMEEVGVRNEMLGEYEAHLRVLNAKKVELTWKNPAGKMVKSVPKAVRENHADELKDLRQSGKDILKMLSAQRERIDNLFLSKRSWSFKDWRDRYIDHPLVGTLGRRLIWSFAQGEQKRSGIWMDDRIVGSDGEALGDLQESTVTLWHPAGEDTDVTVAWRRHVEENEITQPFKQAHREIYLLTEAEETTETYSNRYASHIVKQHQFNALCAARGWTHSLRLMVDDEYEPPTKLLRQYGLRAEFWVEGIGDDYGTDTTEAGSYLYLATDQVRFYRDDAARNSAHAGGGGYRTYAPDNEVNQPLPLRDIDPLVLSEVLRDVDLFIGVASVGNDPNWSDGGPEGRYIDYWSNYSFGELSESARTRKELLEGLIPRLKIRDRCEIEDRFLRVKGDIRTYKIHLGSGNVLMEPSDQYLCIVAAQGRAKAADAIFLPFEGDQRMAVILSKAFLLAEDKKIKDRTILSQIGV